MNERERERVACPLCHPIDFSVGEMKSCQPGVALSYLLLRRHLDFSVLLKTGAILGCNLPIKIVPAR